MVTRVVEIEVRVEGERQLQSLDSTTRSITRSAKTATKVMAGLGVAVSAVVAGLFTLTKNASTSTKELKNLARQTGLTVEEFEALALATQQYGVNAEQISDISKDLTDRIGEFATAGTGAFQDFADVVGLTTGEAKDLAKELQNLSSDQVLIELVNQLEAAGATGAQTTFVLESIGNDLSKLTPLLSDNGRELRQTTNAWLDFSRALNLTDDNIKDLDEFNKSLDNLTTILSKAGRKIGAEFADEFSGFLDGITEEIPEVTNNVLTLFETLQRISSGEFDLNIGTNFTDSLTAAFAEVDKQRKAALEKSKADADDVGTGANVIPVDLEALKKSVETELAILNQGRQLALQVEQGKITDRQAVLEQSTLQTLASIQAEQDAAVLKYGEGQLEQLGILQAFEDQKTTVIEQAAEDRQRIRDLENQAALQGQLSLGQGLLGVVAALSSQSFKTQKKFAIASSLISIASGTAKALDNPYPANLAFAAQVAAQGATLISTIKSTNPSSSGSGISVGGAASAGIGQPTVTEQTQVNRVESTALQDLQNELSQFDPDEQLPVSFTRRIIASIESSSTEGTA